MIEYDERRLLSQRLLAIAERRIAEADATDLSRLAWLCLGLDEVEKAKSLTRSGLVLIRKTNTASD